MNGRRYQNTGRTYSVDGSCALAAGYADYAYEENFERTAFSVVDQTVVSEEVSVSLRRVLTVALRVLMLGAWGAGLLAGGYLGLTCVAAGIIFLGVTSFL